MSAEAVHCKDCDEVGHISCNCPMPAKNNTEGNTKQGKKGSKKEPSGANAGSDAGTTLRKEVLGSQVNDLQRRRLLPAGRATPTDGTRFHD